MTADWFPFPPEVLRKISSRITNEVNGVVRPALSVPLLTRGTDLRHVESMYLRYLFQTSRNWFVHLSHASDDSLTDMRTVEWL